MCTLKEFEICLRWIVHVWKGQDTVELISFLFFVIYSGACFTPTNGTLP